MVEKDEGSGLYFVVGMIHIVLLGIGSGEIGSPRGGNAVLFDALFGHSSPF